MNHNLYESEEMRKFSVEFGEGLKEIMFEKKGNKLILSDFGFLTLFSLAVGFLFVAARKEKGKNEKKDKK